MFPRKEDNLIPQCDNNYINFEVPDYVRKSYYFR